MLLAWVGLLLVVWVLAAVKGEPAPAPVPVTPTSVGSDTADECAKALAATQTAFGNREVEANARKHVLSLTVCGGNGRVPRSR